MHEKGKWSCSLILNTSPRAPLCLGRADAHAARVRLGSVLWDWGGTYVGTRAVAHRLLTLSTSLLHMGHHPVCNQLWIQPLVHPHHCEEIWMSVVRRKLKQDETSVFRSQIQKKGSCFSWINTIFTSLDRLSPACMKFIWKWKLLIFPKSNIRELKGDMKCRKPNQNINVKSDNYSKMFSYTDTYVLLLLFLSPRTNLRQVMHDWVDDILNDM